jgi:hypothetical protein
MQKFVCVIPVFLAAIGCASHTVRPPVLEAQTKSKAPESFTIPRTPEGKPNFAGTHEWPKSTGAGQCRCSAAIFGRKCFAPLKTGGKRSLNRALATPA